MKMTAAMWVVASLALAILFWDAMVVWGWIHEKTVTNVLRQWNTDSDGLIAYGIAALWLHLFAYKFWS